MTANGRDLAPESPPSGVVAVILAWAAILVVTGAMVAYAAVHPGANTDLIFYAATVHQWDGLDDQAIHDAALADARKDLGNTVYQAMVTENDYMRTVAADPEALVQQIPFYSVKPLFPALMIGLRFFGVSLGTAQLLISLASYFLLGLLVFIWLRRHHPPLVAAALGSLIIISSPWAVLARIQSPDALSLLLTVLAIYLLLELRRVGPAFFVLLVTILARPNAVILLIAVALALAALRPGSSLRLSWRWAVAWCAAGIVLTEALIIASGN